MLSRKKKGVLPLNPLKPERWFAFYKERLRHHSGRGGRGGGGSVLEIVAGSVGDGVGTSDRAEEGELGADSRRQQLMRGVQHLTDMKGDESNSPYKRPASAGKVSSDPDQSQTHSSSRSAGSSNRKVELFPSRNRIRTQLLDPRWQREPENLHTTRPRTSALISESGSNSFRPTNSSNVRGSSKVAATRHGVAPAVRRPARSSGGVGSMDKSPPVREEGSASDRTMENGSRIGRGCGGGRFMSNGAKPQKYRYGGIAAMGAGPSCSEQSCSSDSSDFSLDDAQSKACRVPVLEDAMIGHGESSCSSSGSMSPSSLQSRFLDMRLAQQNIDVDQLRRDAQEFEGGPGNAPAGLVGLYNDGNTCYLNSCLQCLAHTLPLASAVLGPYSDQIQKNGGGGGSRYELEGDGGPADVLAYAFHLTVRDLWGKPPFSIASASVILQCVQALAPQFAGSSQHDAQEVLRAILDGLHEALNRVKVATPYRDLSVDQLKPEVELADLTWKYHKSCHDSIIQRIFCGQLQSTIECSVCHRKSHCFDPFMDLSLPLPKSSDASPSPLNSRESVRNSMHRQRVTLQDCLSEFGAPEQLEGSDTYYCPNCKAPRTSTKKLSLFRLPPVLVLHIKRFYGVERNLFTKDETPVYYPLQGLDVSNLMGSKAKKMQGHVYDLYAVCCHMGSMGCGHYTAQCKNCDNNVWYCFNDSSVQAVQDAAVLSSSAYILFYQQRPL